MRRPTRQSIERALLSGEPFAYKSAGKTTNVQLTADSRRLFRYLIDSPLRATKDLAPEFIDGLWAACSAQDELGEPATTAHVAQSTDQRTWRIERVRTTNFGGLNLYQGAEFSWDLKGESWLLDGVNGSGKSSLLGAISWAFTGLRPRDEAPGAAHVPAPVVNAATGKLASWPPLASYPQLAKDLGTPPEVTVAVELVNDLGEKSTHQRVFKNGRMQVQVEGGFAVDEIFTNTSMYMPLALAGLRLKERDGEGSLTRAVTQLTGLEELEVVGEIADGLSHGAREYASYAKKNNLPKLSSFPDVMLVVHSTWRYEYTDEELRGLLGPLGNRFIGSAPRGPREQAIQMVLQANKGKITNYLVLDDAPEEFPEGTLNTMFIDGRFGIGPAMIHAPIVAWLVTSAPSKD